MLDWLKEILGESYSDDIDKKVSGKVGELFVSKADFNKKVNDLKDKDTQIKSLNDQIKDRDGQLEQLKEVDKEGLEQKIKDLQAENKTTKADYDAKIKKMILDAAVEAAIGASGAKDPVSIKAHLDSFLKDAKVGEDGKVVGITEQLDSLKKAETTSFLFGESKAGIAGAKAKETGTGSEGTPPAGGKKPEDMTYDDFVKAEESSGQ